MSGRAPDSRSRCAILEWDSAFFGCRIARFEGASYTDADARATLGFCAEHGVECIYILLDADDAEGRATAQESGARFVDVRVTFEASLTGPQRRLDGEPAEAVIRPATERDRPALGRVARVSHRDTRFHADSRFDADRVALLYETWIEKSCRGWADAVFAVEVEGEAAGYVTCHLDDGIAGRIGLLAVREDLRGYGFSVRLVDAARGWLRHAGCRSLIVATQSRNAAALGLYRASGFQRKAVQAWYHLWPAETAGGLDAVSPRCDARPRV